jgi:ubiquinone/menaquinone biosynthesis C-methylase UbiE
MELQLAQRGRSLIDWEVTARIAANSLQAASIRELAAKGLNADTLPDDMDERHGVIDRALAQSPTYQARHLMSEWCAKNHGLAAQEAFEEVKQEYAPKLDALMEGGTTLETLPHFEMPKYFSHTWFHRTAGGWDAVDYNGFVHGKLIHEYYLSRTFPVRQEQDREIVLEQLPPGNYKRILEIGTSSGYYTQALAQRFPDAEIWGVDPSVRMIEQAQRVGNETGRSWKLFVGMGEDTRFEDESFDLVTGFAVHHEIPPRVARALFSEAFRMLRPGGVMLFADVPPYRDLNKIASWSFDWVARYHGEPFWRAASMLDLKAEAEAAGFADADARGLNAAKFPYIVMGKKPE